MTTPPRVSSSEDLENYPIDPIRGGYRSDSVEDFRDAALELATALEHRIRQLQDAIDDLRIATATSTSAPSLREMLRQADPAIVRAEATAAAGEILAMAVEAAERLQAKVSAELATSRSRTATTLEEIVALAKAGRRPEYELHRLVLSVSALIDKLNDPSSR